MATYSRAPAVTSKEDRVKDLWTIISSDLKSEAGFEAQGGEAGGLGKFGLGSSSSSSTDAFSVFLGERSSGKTTLIQSFMGKEEVTKPTVALEYQFARRPRPTTSSSPSILGAKDVSHVWELGGGLPALSLLGVPFQQALDSSAAVVVLDMEKPGDAVPACAKWLLLLGKKVAEEAERLGRREPERAEAMHRRAVDRFGSKHPDLLSIKSTLSPIPVLIVLNKYDAFKNLDSAPRRAVLQALRFLAHSVGACVVAASSKDKATRDLYRGVARSVLFKGGDGGGGAGAGGDKASAGAAAAAAMHGPWKNAMSIGEGGSSGLSVGFGADTFDAILATVPKGFSRSDFSPSSKDVAARWIKATEAVVGKSGVADLGGEGDDYDDDGGKGGGRLEEGDEEKGEDGKGVGAYPEPAVDDAREAADIRLANYRKEVERQNEILKNSIKVDIKGEGGGLGGREGGEERKKRK